MPTEAQLDVAVAVAPYIHSCWLARKRVWSDNVQQIISGAELGRRMSQSIFAWGERRDDGA